jgi:hypothetical protein
MASKHGPGAPTHGSNPSACRCDELQATDVVDDGITLADHAQLAGYFLWFRRMRDRNIAMS